MLIGIASIHFQKNKFNYYSSMYMNSFTNLPNLIRDKMVPRDQYRASISMIATSSDESFFILI